MATEEAPPTSLGRSFQAFGASKARLRPICFDDLQRDGQKGGTCRKYNRIMNFYNNLINNVCMWTLTFQNEEYPEGLGVFQASVHAVIAQPLFNTSGQVFGKWL